MASSPNPASTAKPTKSTAKAPKINTETKANPRSRKSRNGHITQTMLRQLNPRGNTVLKDFGRVLRDEPHKYIYPIKLYLRDAVPEDRVLRWLRERYIESKGHIHHGTRYETRGYRLAVDGPRYVDYILLERMTDEERVMFTLEFGDVTDEKIVRDGKLRRPRLNKEQKAALDDIINDYYLKVSKQRREEAAAKAAKRGG